MAFALIYQKKKNINLVIIWHPYYTGLVYVNVFSFVENCIYSLFCYQTQHVLFKIKTTSNIMELYCNTAR